MLEHLGNSLQNNSAFEAKLHGFRMRAPIQVQEWTVAEDKRMTKFAEERFEQFEAQSKEPKIGS